VKGNMLAEFTDVKTPCHLSFYTEGQLLVADRASNCILLLSSKLGQNCDTNLQVKQPSGLYYNVDTSQLYVVNSSSSRDSGCSSPTVDVISKFSI